MCGLLVNRRKKFPLQKGKVHNFFKIRISQLCGVKMCKMIGGILYRKNYRERDIWELRDLK